MEQRVIVIYCNDFQGDDQNSVLNAFAGAKMIKGVMDGALEATARQKGTLTAEDRRKLEDMRVTVKVMKVNL